MMRVLWLLLCVLAVAACTRPEQVTVAEAGGQKIRMRHLLQEAALARSRGEPLDDPRTDTLARFYNAATDKLVDQFLLAQEAERRGLRIPSSLVDAEVERLRGESPDRWRAVLSTYHMTEGELRDRIRTALLVERLAETLAEGIRVTDREIRAYYFENRSRFRKPGTARLLTFWVRPEAGERLARDLRGGRPTAQLVDAYRARILELEVREDRVTSVLEREALRSQRGRVLGPYRVGEQAVVARVLAVEPARQMEFSEARVQVEAAMLTQRRRQVMIDLARELRQRRGYRIFFRFRGVPPQAYPVASR